MTQGVKTLKRRSEYEERHLIEARKMLANYNYYIECTDKQEQAHRKLDTKGVEFWRVCFVALLDIWDWQKIRHMNYITASNWIMNVAADANGHYCFSQTDEEFKAEQEAWQELQKEFEENPPPLNDNTEILF